MNEKNAALISLLEKEEVAERIKNAASIEEAISILAENGLVFSQDELKEIVIPLDAALNGDELDEAALETVAGGINWWKVGKLVATVVGALCDFFK